MPKSTTFGVVRFRFVGEEDDVVGLEIAVNDAFCVRGSERARDRQEGAHGLLCLEPSAIVEHGAERGPVEDLHDDERIAELGLAEVEDADDRGMSDLRGGARLLKEAARRLGGAGVAADELDGDVDVEDRVTRQPDCAHPALTEHARERVLAGDELPLGVAFALRLAVLARRLLGSGSRGSPIESKDRSSLSAERVIVNDRASSPNCHRTDDRSRSAPLGLASRMGRAVRHTIDTFSTTFRHHPQMPLPAPPCGRCARHRGIAMRRLAVNRTSMRARSRRSRRGPAAAEPTEADVALARELAVAGITLADNGDCAGAVVKLERAAKLHPAPTILGRLGECHVQLGHVLLGTEILQRVVREDLAADASPAFVKAKERARKVLDEALPKVARLKVHVSAPPGVSADGHRRRATDAGRGARRGAPGRSRRARAGRERGRRLRARARPSSPSRPPSRQRRDADAHARHVAPLAAAARADGCPRGRDHPRRADRQLERPGWRDRIAVGDDGRARGRRRRALGAPSRFLDLAAISTGSSRRFPGHPAGAPPRPSTAPRASPPRPTSLTGTAVVMAGDLDLPHRDAPSRGGTNKTSTAGAF